MGTSHARGAGTEGNGAMGPCRDHFRNRNPATRWPHPWAQPHGISRRGPGGLRLGPRRSWAPSAAATPHRAAPVSVRDKWNVRVSSGSCDADTSHAGCSPPPPLSYPAAELTPMSFSGPSVSVLRMMRLSPAADGTMRTCVCGVRFLLSTDTPSEDRSASFPRHRPPWRFTQVLPRPIPGIFLPWALRETAKHLAGDTNAVHGPFSPAAHNTLEISSGCSMTAFVGLVN